jgi:hypothetical protein
MKIATCKLLALIFVVLLIAGCAGGSSRMTYGVGVGYGGYYGAGPWRGHGGYPVYVGGGGGPDMPHIPDGPSASQMPEFGMPDAGMMDMDMGGFDF